MPSTTTKRPSQRTDVEEIQDVQEVDTTEAERLLDLSDDVMADIDALLESNDTQALRDALEEADAPALTLSDLMREGALMTDQAFSAFENQKGETCAIGSTYKAMEARGLV